MYETRESDSMSSSIVTPCSQYSQYGLGLSEQDQSKPHMVINALKECYGASIGVSGERQNFLSLLQNEEESIAS